jgi:hypothetical protein
MLPPPKIFTIPSETPYITLFCEVKVRIFRPQLDTSDFFPINSPYVSNEWNT